MVFNKLNMSSIPHIKNCQTIIAGLIKKDIETNKNFKSLAPGVCIKDVASYSLNSGKRLRPMITYSISESEHFSLFIEYVHNSSLIVDDLPCMDNDSQRRGQPTVHVKYGEYTAQLMAYNLMITAMKHLADGFSEIRKSKLYSEQEYDLLYSKINEEISSNLGYHGICGGQYLDLLICSDQNLQNQSPRVKKELLMKIIKLKTGCLFSLSLVLAWIYNGRDISKIQLILDAGCAFGLCYQIIDDLRDIEKDTSKNDGHNNIAKYYTYNEIIDLFTDNLEKFARTATRFDLWNDTMKELYHYMLTGFKKEITILKKK